MRYRAVAVFLGVTAQLVAENPSFSKQPAAQEFIKNDCGVSEVALSLVVNQMALLRILNESSTSSLYERQLQKMVELEVKTGELKNDLQDTKIAAMNELQNMTATTLNNTKIRNEEAAQDFQDLKEAAVQELQNMTTILNEANTRNEEAAQTLQDFMTAALQELQTMKTTIMDELRQATKRKTYRKYDIARTPSEAQEDCKQLGGRLALPMNKEEDEKIQRIIGLSPRTSRVYLISGTDEQEDGNWIDSVTGEPLPYTNFQPGEPNNSKGGEGCINKNVIYRGWNDLKCDRTGTGYVCEFAND